LQPGIAYGESNLKLHLLSFISPVFIKYKIFIIFMSNYKNIVDSH
jgi:hypothetical protein